MGRVAVLIRHASVSEASDSKLDDSGIKMTSALAKELVRLTPDHVFSSPVPRARRTAEIIASNIQLVVREDERLVERRAERLKENNFKVNWLEGFDSVMFRMSSFFADLPEGVSLAITHKESIRAAISAALGMDEVTGSGIKVANCSLTSLAVADGTTKLLSIGSPSLPKNLVKRISEAV